MQIRVYYEDTDCGGVVYHSQYLNFCERARSEYFFDRGYSPHSDDSFFVVKRVEADYIASAVFADILDINTKLITIKNASLTIEQTIYKENKLLFKAVITLAFLKNMKPSKIPLEFKEIFQELL